jgi:hypothetical protein
MPRAAVDTIFKRRTLAAGAIVGLLIPTLSFALYFSGGQIFVPQIFNLQWTDYVIYLVWPSLILLLLMNKSMLFVGTISVLLNVILYAAYGYALALIWPHPHR